MQHTEAKPIEAVARALELVRKSGFALTPQDLAGAKAVDFGLSNFDEEGAVVIDLLRTERVRVNLLVMMPGQTLPQHKHPPYGDHPGKEESIRVLWGELTVAVDGEVSPDLSVPAGKDPYYTVRHLITLEKAEQYTVPPNEMHWFQAGSEGAVAIAFQNRVNEDYNIFADPASDGCPIPNTPTVACTPASPGTASEQGGVV